MRSATTKEVRCPSDTCAATGGREAAPEDVATVRAVAIGAVPTPAHGPRPPAGGGEGGRVKVRTTGGETGREGRGSGAAASSGTE